MGKLKIRGCAHCGNGEVFIDHDQYGWYESCLQCGYSRDLPDLFPPAPGLNPEPEKKQRAMTDKKRTSGARKRQQTTLAPFR